MDESVIGIVGVGVLLLLIAVRVPIALALVLVGAGGHAILVGPHQTVAQMGITVWELGSNFLLIAIPLFVLMGQLVLSTGIATDLFDCAHKWLGRLPGGLAVTAVGTCAAFGAVTGSSLAAVATMGRLIMPEMERYGYDRRLATGSIAAAGTLAILIPPSILLVFYGIWTETSIGALFLAGIVPGAALAIALMLLIVGRCTLNPGLGPRGPTFSWHQRFTALLGLLPALAVFLVIIGGIYFALFTPTEAAGAGVVAVLVLALVMRRLTWASLAAALRETGIVSSTIFLLLIGATLMSKFLVHTEITEDLVNYVAGLAVSRYAVMLMLVLMYLALGAILDTFGMIVLTLPFVFPVVLQLGFDAIWFGIFLVLLAELALITPPIGVNLFIMHDVAPEVPVRDVILGALPFAAVMLMLILLLIAMPGLALWLPSKM